MYISEQLSHRFLTLIIEISFACEQDSTQLDNIDLYNSKESLTSLVCGIEWTELPPLVDPKNPNASLLKESIVIKQF